MLPFWGSRPQPARRHEVPAHNPLARDTQDVRDLVLQHPPQLADVRVAVAQLEGLKGDLRIGCHGDDNIAGLPSRRGSGHRHRRRWLSFGFLLGDVERAPSVRSRGQISRSPPLQLLDHHILLAVGQTPRVQRRAATLQELQHEAVALDGGLLFEHALHRCPATTAVRRVCGRPRGGHEDLQGGAEHGAGDAEGPLLGSRRVATLVSDVCT
mmetsp:Transcript_108563/g.346523  ORF Transcript_108563/g.346523 Transcript_108563/m.346523 type:complete len:211 (-) Transcript_108563:582-1214(-)